LQRIKENPELRHLPVVMVSAVDDYEQVARCIAAGAEDYIFKPFDEMMLRARVDASLARKVWHDREVAYRRQLQSEREKADDLLLNILPAPVMKRLKQGESLIADAFAEVTILFADIANFTAFSADFPPEQTVSLLDGLFSHFDDLVQGAGLEKIKTIGDAYLVAGGMPIERPDHTQAVADLALAMHTAVSEFQWPNGESVRMRSGIDVGPVVAGVIGKKKFAYDIWGDVVNTANRLQTMSRPGHIHVSGDAYARLRDHYVLQKRGAVPVKGKGEMVTYFLQEKRPLF
jgi:class 3 adenylate cyclase